MDIVTVSLISLQILNKTLTWQKGSKLREKKLCWRNDASDATRKRWFLLWGIYMNQPLLQSGPSPVRAAYLSLWIQGQWSRSVLSPIRLCRSKYLSATHEQSTQRDAHVGRAFSFFESLFQHSSLIAAVLYQRQRPCTNNSGSPLVGGWARDPSQPITELQFYMCAASQHWNSVWETDTSQRNRWSTTQSSSRNYFNISCLISCN